MVDIDKILFLPNSRRDHTAGFIGDRLFVESLDDKLGFRGSFGIFHDCRRETSDLFRNLLPIGLFPDSRAEQVLRYDWAPTHIKRLVKCHYVDYQERKTIARCDVAISEVKIVNHGPRMEQLAPKVDGDLNGSLELRGQTVHYRRGASVHQTVVLAPGESITVVFAVAVGVDAKAVEANLALYLGNDGVDKIIAAERGFYDENVPEFHCDDKLIEQIYYYRHYVLRHNSCRPGAGFLRHPVFYEGRTCGYNRLITASASLALDECRWWRNPEIGYGQIRTLVENLPDHGIFRDLWINKVNDLSWPGYEEWIPRAMADFLLIHPNLELARRTAEAGLRNIAGLLERKDRNGNLMLNPGGHHMTQEHSPAFTYFHNGRDWYDYTDLERIEYQAFFYGSITGTARLLRLLDDPRASELETLAAKVKETTLRAMWHAEDRFFYAIRESDGAFARYKEGNGFLAFLYGLAPFEEPYTRIFRYFVDENFFWNPYPIASCAKDVPSYTPHQAMWGDQLKEVGCTWSGPTWPYFNSLFINVLGGLLRSGGPSAVSPAIFRNFFDLFTQGHLEAGSPMIRENQDGLTGAQRGCPDYLHATYIDLVVRHLMGLCPESPASGLSPLLGVGAVMRGVPLDGKRWNLEVFPDNRGKMEEA